MRRGGDDSTTSDPPADVGASVVRVRQIFVLFSPSRAVRAAITLAGPPITIGREGHTPSHLVLPDRHVSREHAVVSLDPARDAWSIADRGSHNGTFVNGQRVDSVPLEHGAVIRVGGSVLIYLDQELSVDDDEPSDRLFGPSPAMLYVRREVLLVARERTPVLICGETGVGKELVAAEIHRLSGRRGPLVPVNCAAIAPSLAESELFGHAVGAFTGAVRRGEGLFAAAEEGTLFLDEIGELPLELQPKLLRALAVGEVRAVGAVAAQALNVRFIAATNRDLDAEVRAGRFRADLLARLAAWRIEVPALCSRREDVLPLAKLFMTRATAGGARLSADAAEALLLHSWPYNVRELEQVVAGAVVRAGSTHAPRSGELTLRVEHLPHELAAPLRARSAGAAPPSEMPLLAAVQRDATPTADDLRLALSHFGGNVSQVARFFRRTRKQIYRWAHALQVDIAGARDPD